MRDFIDGMEPNTNGTWFNTSVVTFLSSLVLSLVLHLNVRSPLLFGTCY